MADTVPSYVTWITSQVGLLPLPQAEDGHRDHGTQTSG